MSRGLILSSQQMSIFIIIFTIFVTNRVIFVKG